MAPSDAAYPHESATGLRPRLAWPEGLTLRRRSDDDTADLFALLAHDDFQHNGSTLDPFAFPDDAVAFFASLPPQAFEVVARRQGCLVGYGGVYPAAGRQRHTGSLTICVDHAHQRQGIGSILLATLVATAWHAMDLSRLQLTVFADNPRALSLCRRFGFRREGRIANFVQRPNGFVDAFLMALLKP